MIYIDHINGRTYTARICTHSPLTCIEIAVPKSEEYEQRFGPHWVCVERDCGKVLKEDTNGTRT